VGGPIDLVTLVRRPTGPAGLPSVLSAGVGGDVASVLRRRVGLRICCDRAALSEGPPPVAHMRPDPAAFTGALRRTEPASPRARVLLLDDTYVSGVTFPERRRRAAAGRGPNGDRPLGRVLRPERVALHADFLGRQPPEVAGQTGSSTE